MFKWEIIRKIRLYPFWCPCWNKPFLHLISCSDDFQIMKFNHFKSHAFLQHSTLLSFYTFVWSCSERSWKMVKFRFWNFRSFNTQWFDRKNPKFFCSNMFPFLTFLVPIINYMHVVIIWEPERCPTICKQDLTTKSTLVYYYFLWLDKGKRRIEKCQTFQKAIQLENLKKQLKTFRMSVSLHELILCCIWGLFWLTDCFEVFPSSSWV